MVMLDNRGPKMPLLNRPVDEEDALMLTDLAAKAGIAERHPLVEAIQRAAGQNARMMSAENAITVAEVLRDHPPFRQDSKTLQSHTGKAVPKGSIISHIQSYTAKNAGSVRDAKIIQGTPLKPVPISKEDAIKILSDLRRRAAQRSRRCRAAEPELRGATKPSGIVKIKIKR